MKSKKKKKKKVLTSFYNFSYFYFKFSAFPFTIFLLFFSILPLFPFFSLRLFSRYVNKNFPVKSLWGALCPLPATCYATAALNLGYKAMVVFAQIFVKQWSWAVKQRGWLEWPPSTWRWSDLRVFLKILNLETVEWFRRTSLSSKTLSF